MIGQMVCCGGICGGAAILAVIYAFTVYNGLVGLRNNIEKSLANIDVLLKKRSDLIPNLVQTVKGYMKHEREVLECITKLRTEVACARTLGQKARASDEISSALKTIFAVAENYPKLEASKNFLRLQEQLTAMENRIADRREFYNHSVLLYNNRIMSLPDKVFASLFGFKQKEYFRATEEEKKTVDVKV